MGVEKEIIPINHGSELFSSLGHKKTILGGWALEGTGRQGSRGWDHSCDVHWVAILNPMGQLS